MMETEIMMNPLEQHNSLYQLAYKKFMNNEMEYARQLALEAVSKAHEFYLDKHLSVPVDKFSCRAQSLLEMIEERSQVAKK
ncbi:MAG: hypothetical protein IPH59_15490 [bacterium]|nr:hypothetical protein [bacterium]